MGERLDRYGRLLMVLRREVLYPGPLRRRRKLDWVGRTVTMVG